MVLCQTVKSVRSETVRDEVYALCVLRNPLNTFNTSSRQLYFRAPSRVWDKYADDSTATTIATDRLNQ